MVFEFKFPDVGEGITEGEVVKWLVKEGDVVNLDQTLAKIETDKAIVEIPSPKQGRILKLLVKEGDIIKVGSVLVTFEGEGPEPRKSFGVVGELEEAPEEEANIITARVSTAPTEEILAAPIVRRLAKEIGVDISQVKGSGPGGRVIEEDVRNFKGQPIKKEARVVKKYDLFGYVDRVPFKGVRKATAKKMVESIYTATHVTHMDDCDVTDLATLRDSKKSEAEKKSIKLTYLPFIVKAVIETLKLHPYFNAELDEGNNEIILKKYFNIGIAVDTEEGLLVPVVKIADQKGLFEIAEEIANLAKAAKERTIDIMDMQGGCFTITNVGSLGGVYATPIINFPEVAILALGKITDKAVVNNNKMVIRKILPLSLSFDHRIVDGAEAARFVNDIKKYLENPGLIFK